MASNDEHKAQMNASDSDTPGPSQALSENTAIQRQPSEAQQAQGGPPPPRIRPIRPYLSRDDTAFTSQSNLPFATDGSRSPTSTGESQLSPGPTDRVFPIRSVVSVEPTPTPGARPDRPQYSYFQNAAQARRQSLSNSDFPHATQHQRSVPAVQRSSSPRPSEESARASRKSSTSASIEQPLSPYPSQHQYLTEIMADSESVDDAPSVSGLRPASSRAGSYLSVGNVDDGGMLVTARFKHVVTEGGHAIITGRDGDTLQRCEDEPIHIPGAIQGFGLLIALEEQREGKLIVRVVSENSKKLIGYTPKQLFALDSFTDILSEEQADNLLDHIDFIREEDADVVTNGPEVFTMTIRLPQRRSHKMWCAMHINERHPHLIICEFELEDDPFNPLVPPNDGTPELPEDTLDSQPTEEEYQESTANSSKPLRVLRSSRKRKGEAAALEVFNIMSQVQEQLAAAPNLETFLKVLVGVVKELTGFHRVMIYQFDQAWNGRVVTELVDPRATKDLYKGLNFPASDIPKQARDLYKVNKVRMLYDRDQETARLVCRTLEDLEMPLDLTHSYLRAMSPIHLKYLANMAVRSSMSISINAFEELWGLIACHTYGPRGMRVSFPIRKMCRLVGDSASRNIERLSYASRLQARKLINTVPTQSNPSGYIIASSEDLLKLFDADFGLLSIRDETKILGHIEQSQEALAMLEYLRMRRIMNVMTSQDIKTDFPDLRYPPGFQVIAGLLLVPLSVGGNDFIVFFRKGQLREVKWAGNPYEKFIKEGTEGYLEPRKSFRTWSEMVVGKCREWTEDEIETAAVLCLVYGKFIEVWRQKEAALQNSQLTRLLLANSAHEVRTPLNAIINYLEIALEGSLDNETRENLAKSHSASKSLIYVINDLLDLTKTEEGGDLIKDEIFDVKTTLQEATDMFRGDARRKNITYAVSAAPGLPSSVIGDQRRVRQAISNVTANAIQNTTQGSVNVEMYLASRGDGRCEVEVSVADTGSGMSSQKLDQLFRELEQVQSEADDYLRTQASLISDEKSFPEPGKKRDDRTLGLGLAVVARIVRNMNGQLRLKSEEGQGSRFVIQFPFDLPDGEPKSQHLLQEGSSAGSITPHAEKLPGRTTPKGEVTLIDRSSQHRPSSDEAVSRNQISRKNSAESFGSKHSLNSMKSVASNISWSSQRSGKSEADRLIEAIQEPHRVEGHFQRSGSLRDGSASSSIQSVGEFGAVRPPLLKRHTTATAEMGSKQTPITERPRSLEVSTAPGHLRGFEPDVPGQTSVTDQGMPLRPVRVPDEYIVSPTSPMQPSSATAAPFSATSQDAGAISFSEGTEGFDPDSAEHMRVLVAEDDLVNSRIIKKRLEKLGHSVVLTVNGEDCASTYCDKSNAFDIILMDMQMPIVDGLTSTKMIRSFEKTHNAADHLSKRAARNGRVPIIAVSASLVERERPTYIDAGFDGWILKPISFPRMSDILTGIVIDDVRRDNLYRPGKWEYGGWFGESKQWDKPANTMPSGEPPLRGPEMQPSGSASEGVRKAAASDDPFVREEDFSEQTQEQARLAQQQAQGRQEEQHFRPLSKAVSMPEPCAIVGSEASTISDLEQVASPPPMEPNDNS